MASLLALLPALLPVLYSLLFRKKSLKDCLLVFACASLVTAAYEPVLYGLGLSGSVFLTVEFGLLVLLPVAFMVYIEKEDFEKCFRKAGLTGRRMEESVKLGLAALLLTLPIYLLANPAGTGYSSLIAFFDDYWVFLEAFNREFFFRGFLLIYLLRKTGRMAAYASSVLAFLLWNPGGESWLALLVHGIALAFVSEKSRNITGAAVAHGLNSLLQRVFFTFFS